MIKLLQLLFVTLLWHSSIAAQTSKKAANWFFGFEAGLDFNSPTPSPIINGELNSVEACTSISDQLGNLIFYSDGITVWGSDHNILNNGTGLTGSPTTSQGAIIIQVPQNDTLYYLFSKEAGNGDLFYSIIDIDQNGLNGSVIQKNIFLHSTLTEKLCAVVHCNNRDVWLAAVESEKSTFVSFLITSAGIQPHVSSTLHSAGVPLTGCMKFSPDGNFLAYLGADDIGIVRFNNSTGKFYGCGEIRNTLFEGDSYGVEFSANSQWLYFNMGSSVYQAKLNGLKENLIDTMIRVGKNFGNGLQISSDKKIYISDLDTIISAIEFPNLQSPFCSYLPQSVHLGGRSAALGLPSFVASYFNEKKGSICNQGNCLHEPIIFEYNTDLSLDSVKWTISNSSSIILSTSDQQTLTHTFTKAGAYKITLECHSGGTIVETLVKYLYFDQGHDISLIPDDSILCDNPIKLSVDGKCLEGNLTWSDSSELDFIMITQPGNYSLTINNECYRETRSITIEQCLIDSILIPNVFTPNNDGINDLFSLQLPADVTGFYLSIYNRWGKQLFTTDDPQKVWDGRYHGNDVPEGVYYYTCFYTSKNGAKNRTGFFSLLR